MAIDDDMSFGDELLDTVFNSMGEWESEDYSDKDFGLTDVVEAFWNGWVDFENLSEEERAEFRAEFFDYAEEFGYDIDDFDWESWREYMYG